MKLSDRISQYTVDCWFVPAWREQKPSVDVRAGDVHKGMGLHNRVPAVCSVLGSQRFQQLTRATLAGRGGPHTGANSTFTFRL